MNWMDSIKHAIVESDPEPTPVPATTLTAAPASSAPFVVPASSATTGLPAGSALLTDNTGAPTTQPSGFLAKLRTKITDPSDPVSKLEATLASLTAIPEMSMRVAAAVGVLKATASIPLDQLQACYKYRLSVLEQQITQFASAITAQTSAEVTARETAVSQTTADIESHSKAIQELSAKRETLNADIITAKTKLAAAQAGFDGAVVALKQELTEAANRLTGVQQ